jgi:hypothetical protein
MDIATARSNTRERIENQKKAEDAVEKKDVDWACDCTTDVISERLDYMHTTTHLPVWAYFISLT